MGRVSIRSRISLHLSKHEQMTAHCACTQYRQACVQATLDLHFMDCAAAQRVVEGCLEELLRAKQQGQLDIITGRGAHSASGHSRLKPLVQRTVKAMGLTCKKTESHEGVVKVLIKSR